VRVFQPSPRSTVVAASPVQVVAVEDFVLSKLAWAKDSRSEYQLRDVRSLLELQPSMDGTHLERWAPSLGVADLLEEVSRR